MAYNVLLVDDSETTRAIIAKTLRLAGVPVGTLLEAGNGEEALELLSHEWVDLVFADLNMPVMDGMELVSRMSQDGLLANIPVVVVSTEGSERRMSELKLLGIKAYVRKPFTPEKLGRLVNELLAGPPPVDLARAEDAFYEAAEGFAFLVAGRIEPADAPSPDDAHVAEMAFSGGLVRGRAAILAPAETGAFVAESALGEPDEVGSEQAYDALKELLNVACGQILTALYGVDAVFDLEPPRVRPAQEGEWEAAVASEDVMAFDLEGTVILLVFSVEAS